MQEAYKNPLLNHQQVMTYTGFEENPKPIVVKEGDCGECSDKVMQDEEVADSLMKSSVFRNLFEALKLNE